MATDQKNIFRREVDDTHALSTGLSVMAAIIIFLVILALVKFIYLKYRRIRMIHNLQAVLSPSSLEVSELGALTPDQLGRSSERAGGGGLSRDILVDIDPLGLPTRTWGRQSKCPSRASNDSRRTASPAPSPLQTPGIIVGLLGSPAWETRMRRELDDHRWRQQRRPTATAVDAFTPSEPSQQTLQTTVRSYTPNASRSSSRESQNRPQLPSQPSDSSQNQLLAPQTLPRRRPRSAQFHSERRTVTRVTSLGELEVEEVNVTIRRPQSLSAVMDQAMAAMLVRPQKQGQPQRSDRVRPLSDSRVQLDHSTRSRPSPIVEEVPSPVPSVGINRNLQQRVVQSTSRDGTSQTCIEGTPVYPNVERDVGLGIRRVDPQDGARASGASSDIDLSVANSMSFGQLRQFPEPPEQAIALAVHIPPVDFDKLEMSWRLSKESDFLYKTTEGLRSFVDLYPDYYSPSQNFLRGATPYSDNHTLSCPLSSSSDSSSTTLRNSCDCDSPEPNCALDLPFPADLDIADSEELDYETTSLPAASALFPSHCADFRKECLSHSPMNLQNNGEESTDKEQPNPGTPTTPDDQTTPSASSRRLAFVVSMASSRSSLSFRSVLSGRYSLSLAAGASAIMGQPEDAATVTSPSSARQSMMSNDERRWSPKRLSLRDSGLVSRRYTFQTPKSFKDVESRQSTSFVNRDEESTKYLVDTGKESRPLSLQDVQEDEMLVLGERDSKSMHAVNPRKLVFLRDSQFKPFERPSFSRQSSWEARTVEVVRPDSISRIRETANPNDEDAFGLYPAPYIIEEEAEETDLGLASLAILGNVANNDDAQTELNLGIGQGCWNASFADERLPAEGSILSFSLSESTASLGSSCGCPDDTRLSGEESTEEL